MVFSRYIWTVLLLVLLIVATSVVLGIYLQKAAYPITRSMLIVLLVAESIGLFYYLIRIRKDMLKLVHALRNEDPSLQFSRKGKDPYFSAIHRGFNEIIKDFRLVRLDKEAERRFFEATVNHVQFALLAFDSRGRVRMANETCLSLFQLKELVQIETLADVSEELVQILEKLSHQKEMLQKVNIGGIQRHLIFLASRFRLLNEEITLISIRDISREIDKNELEAWQKLLRLLRHEILNSITPIRLLSSNLSDMFEKEKGAVTIEELTEKELEDLKTGLRTIFRRSTSLSKFLDAYSNLYRVPELKIGQVEGKKLLERTAILFRDQLAEEKIELQIDCPADDLVFFIDERMIEQVLINLVKNAIQAVKNTEVKRVVLIAAQVENHPAIIVRDSGSGIPEEQLDSIFIPFYSTHSGGSGIGLSFSQHVMRLHSGRIIVNSKPGEGSEFQLIFSQT